MKRSFSLFLLMVGATLCIAQIIENPTFDRSDEAIFHITRVKIAKDTTYVFCSYYAEAGAWASISKETYLRDSKSHKAFPLLRCDGLPFSPEERSFPKNERCEFVFCFPSIAGIEQFDFIESEVEKGFNIYGINLKRSYKTSYTNVELKLISEMVSAYDSSDTEMKKRLKEYAISLSNLVSFNASIGNHAEAIRLGTVEMEIREKVFGKEHPSYIKTLSNLVGYYTFLGKYSEAIKLQTEVIKVLKNNHGTDNIDYTTSLSELASYYAYIGNYLETVQLGKEIVEIHKKISGVNSPHYAIALNNLSLFYAYLGNYSEAILLGKEALKIEKLVLGTDNFDYAQSVNNIAGFYSDLGNYKEAIIFGKEAVRIKKNVFGTEHPEYALSLSNLAGFYSGIGDYAEALRLKEEVIEIRRRLLGTEHPDYARSLHDLSVDYYRTGKYAEAQQLLTEATRIREVVLGPQHPDYAFSLNDLALCHARTGNYTEAIRIGGKVLEIWKNVLGTEHPNYALALSSLASFYSRIGNYKESYSYLKQYINSSQSYIVKHFVELSSNLRESLWTRNYAPYYISVFPSIVEKYKTKHSISELYDVTCLFTKGLLLNTDMEMRNLILESGDSVLIAKYNDLISNIGIYNKLIGAPINKQHINADSLNNVIEQQEMELAKDSKVYGNFMHNLTINWRDVEKKLGDNDIAVEFLDFPIFNSDSILYVALTLKKGYDSPRMVTLFNENQLKSIPESVYFTQTDVYDLIWKPLEEELRGIKNVYFAPSGELHRIGIEYLPISKTDNISNVYTFHRLSSTRQLAIIQDETKGMNNILYGGINYDEKSSTIFSDSASIKSPVFRNAFTFRANVDSLSLRSSFEYLEGTKKEADMIAKDLKQHSVPYIYYSGTEATEESFKLLDGTKPKAMHIATHGFYFTETEAGKSQFARPELELKGNGIQNTGHLIEDKPMTRSGLLFSGCNHAFRHEQIPEGEEDGILTAQEIAMLDLRGLDLVVLSACQTGLGDVISGEGVFGLQRGFKKAGAKTILMSLAKVDDEATRILMVDFYKNLMSGKTKYQSLKDAQKHLRQVENGKYDKPEYWASFIMLDGIN